MPRFKTFQVTRHKGFHFRQPRGGKVLHGILYIRKLQSKRGLHYRCIYSSHRNQLGQLAQQLPRWLRAKLLAQGVEGVAKAQTGYVQRYLSFVSSLKQS